MKNQEKIIAAVLILLFLAIMTIPLWARTTAPGAIPCPGDSQFGKRNSPDQGASVLSSAVFKIKQYNIAFSEKLSCCIIFIMLNNILEQNIILFSNIGNIPELGKTDSICNIVASGVNATKLQVIDRNITSIQIIA